MAFDAQSPARVIIVDDHPIVRLGIRQMISAEAMLSVCGEADTAESALSIARTSHPDLAIVDLSLGDTTGLDLIRALREIAPDLPVLVLSVHEGMLFAERALRAGARGYITKREAIGGLVSAIREVLSGQLYVSSDIPRGVLGRASGEPGAGERIGNLTDRELAVFEMIGRGMSTAAIAEYLALSVKTVETYRSNIKTKLDLKSGTDLVRYAAIWAERM